MHTPFTCRLAVEDDLEPLLKLHHKYLFHNLSEEQKKNGFIRVEYSRDEFRKMIRSQAVVIALKNEKLCGYYLVGKTSESLLLAYQRNEARSIADINGYEFSKIGYGCQICIDEPHRHQGLFALLLEALSKAVKNKFTVLLCSVSDNNTASMHSHMNNGWAKVNAIDNTSFFIYKLPEKELT